MVKGETANELKLDHVFWTALTTDQHFKSWLFGRTKFVSRQVELDTSEKWHQRWYRDPETKQDSETDILVMLKEGSTGERFALHIENKPAHRAWEPGQPENYRKRALNRMGKWGYVDFQTVLLAPLNFIAGSVNEAKHFDLLLFYEDVGAFAPEFADAALLSALGGADPLDALRLYIKIQNAEIFPNPDDGWVRQVQLGDFTAIPPNVRWDTSSSLAHLVDGYALAGGLSRCVQLANERLEEATQIGRWRGSARELWVCLFAEHRRTRHSGWPRAEDEIHLLDQLCGTLRASLQIQMD